MARALCGFLIALLLWAAPQALAGEVRSESIFSPVLGRSLPYTIYLPDKYNGAERHYPVLYLLHGAGGNEQTWVKEGGLKDKVDALISSGAIPPTLVVMPSCPECWWIDGAQDRAETAFWNDLVPAIEESYSTIETRDGRLIAGLSAGGYGAVRYALRYPDRVAAIAALSPAIYAETPPTISSARRMPAFRTRDGSFDQSSWDAHNYPRLIDRYFSQSLRVPFYLVSGDHDQYGIAFETALLFKRLFKRQPAWTEMRVVSGEHSWDVWSASISDALRYIYRYAARPQQVAVGSLPDLPQIARHDR